MKLHLPPNFQEFSTLSHVENDKTIDKSSLHSCQTKKAALKVENPWLKKIFNLHKLCILFEKIAKFSSLFNTKTLCSHSKLTWLFKRRLIFTMLLLGRYFRQFPVVLFKVQENIWKCLLSFINVNNGSKAWL